MSSKMGFSLMEFLLVIIISGLTVSALFTMVDVSLKQYAFTSRDGMIQTDFGRLRVLLRNAVLTASDTLVLSSEELNKAANMSETAFVDHIKVSTSSKLGFFITLSVCYDANKNSKAEESECIERVFFFRRRA